MKKVKRFAGLFMMLLAATFAKAQDESKLETSISADVVNQYIWRVRTWAEHHSSQPSALAAADSRSAHGEAQVLQILMTRRSSTSRQVTPLAD